MTRASGSQTIVGDALPNIPREARPTDCNCFIKHNPMV